MNINRVKLIVFCAVLLPTNLWADDQAPPQVAEKLQPYIECINRISERAFQSQDRYVSWAGDNTSLNSKAKNILGLYEIYDPSDCAKGVDEANATEPHNVTLESAGAEFVKSSQALDLILKTANDYYDQGNYKDDKLAKGKEMHPQLLAAFNAFGKADHDLRSVVQKINDERQIADLAAIEKNEGHNAHYLIEAMMIKAKAVVRVEGDVEEKKIDLAQVTETLNSFEASVKELETYGASHNDERIGSMLIDNSKSFMTSAKEFMRRIRDKVPYDEGQKMILNEPNAGWMVEGSQPRLTHDYNQLVDTYNQHANL